MASFKVLTVASIQTQTVLDILRTDTAGSFGTVVHTTMHSITYKKTAIFKTVASILMQIFIQNSPPPPPKKKTPKELSSQQH
jgi:hypothetical protein